jgi:hypothetical protein
LGRMLSRKELRRADKIIVDLSPLHEFQRALSGETIWTTRDKQRIPVREMKTSHIENCIAVLKGESPIGTTYRCDDITRRNWIEIFNIELEKRRQLP